jgi:hypothetical protein
LASGRDSQAEPRKETEIIDLDSGDTMEIFYHIEKEQYNFQRLANRGESAILARAQCHRSVIERATKKAGVKHASLMPDRSGKIADENA